MASGVDRSDFSAFQRYASGRMHAGHARTPEGQGYWVKVAAQTWPGSEAWYSTPFWYLAQHPAATLEDIYKCARMLPRWHQEDLLTSAPHSSHIAARLALLSPHSIHTLADPLDPWSLGAFICLMRRAQYADDPYLVRQTWVAFSWALEQFIERNADPLRGYLIKLREITSEQFSQAAWCGQFRLAAPPSRAELARFAAEHDRFVEFFKSGELSSWNVLEAPPWVSSLTPRAESP